MVHKSQKVVDKLSSEGIEIELIDIRTIAPLDIDLILSSVKKTARAIIVHEDCGFMGFGAEIAATIADCGFEFLDAPVKRVAGLDTPIPHAPQLEDAVLPQESDIERGLRELLAY